MNMRLFGKNTEIEIEDIRVRVWANIIDRLTGFFSPEWKLQRLRARAALVGGGQTPRPFRRVISEGIKTPKKEGLSVYGSNETAERLRWFNR